MTPAWLYQNYNNLVPIYIRLICDSRLFGGFCIAVGRVLYPELWQKLSILKLTLKSRSTHFMIQPIYSETLQDWARRTKGDVPNGEITVQGAPLSNPVPSSRIYTFQSDSTKEQIEEFFNDLYSRPGNPWRWKKITLKLEGASYILRPLELHQI